VRITDSGGDQARAAGVLIDFAQGRPIVVDARVTASSSTAPSTAPRHLIAKATAAAKEKKTARQGEEDRPRPQYRRRAIPRLRAARRRRRQVPYSQSGERTRIAAGGVRLVVKEMRKQPADPGTVAKRDAQLRQLTDQAYGANLDLGNA
jgi:hypothetical protein